MENIEYSEIFKKTLSVKAFFLLKNAPFCREVVNFGKDPGLPVTR
jgi:hypothetical protein